MSFFVSRPFSSLIIKLPPVVQVLCQGAHRGIHFKEMIQKMYMELVLQHLANITIDANIVFQEILAMTRIRHIISSMRVMCRKTVVISNKQMQMICDMSILFGKWNSHSKFTDGSHITTSNPFLSYCHFV